jgi:hypothetical protein
MIWQSSEEITEAPVKPMVQKKVSVQALLWLLSTHALVPEGFPSKILGIG